MPSWITLVALPKVKMMTQKCDSLKMNFNARGAAPGHPVKFWLHRSSYDLGPHYKNVVDWKIDRSKSLYRKNLVAHFGCVNAIEFSRDGSLLASGGDDRRVLIWNVDKALVTKDEPKVMEAEHLSNIFCLDFSCTSGKIISAGNDDQVVLHDVATGAPLDYFMHEQPVYGVSADPVNESVFCSACDDGRLLIFDTRESTTDDPFCLAKLNSSFHSVMFHPLEPRLIVSANSREGVATWDVRMPKKTLVKYGMQNSNQCCMSARFNRTGTQILVLRRRLPPILYSTDSPCHLYQFNHRGYYNSCTMKSCSFAGQDDQYVLSGSDNFDLHLWKIPTPGSDQWVNRADMVLRGHRSIVNQVRYNYTHNVIASSGVEKIVKLWSSFPLPDETGGKSPATVMNESERRIYTPDDYVSLVLQSGQTQGQFMSLTYEAGRKTTREDSRMLAFFDALVQRDINGMSDDDSDNFPETSYTNTVYTSPETSSSENEDEDSNPPNYRALLSNSSGSLLLGRVPAAENSQNNVDSLNQSETLSDQGDAAALSGRHGASNEQNEIADEAEHAEDVNPPLRLPLPPPEEGDDDSLISDVGNLQTEDRDMTANMITQLILEKEENRRKLLQKSKQTASNNNAHVSGPDSESTSSDEASEGSSKSQASSSRPLCLTRRVKRVRRRSSHQSNPSYASSHNNFRKQLLQARRREMLSSTPVYESSRNTNEAAGGSSSEISFERINELMTRNPCPSQSDSSIDSSSTSSSDSSSSDVDEVDKKGQSVIRTKQSSSKPPVSRAIISTDSSDSESEVKPDAVQKTRMLESETPANEPSTSSAHTSKDLKRKWRPQCKLDEACKLFFRKYIAGLDPQRESESAEPVIPFKRAHLDNLDKLSIPDSTTDTGKVEQVVFKRLNKQKSRTYRKNSVESGATRTPPDSGIDVSKEAEPCCSKSFKGKKNHPSSSAEETEACPQTKAVAGKEDIISSSTSDKNIIFASEEHLDDPGFGQVESDAESE